MRVLRARVPKRYINYISSHHYHVILKKVFNIEKKCYSFATHTSSTRKLLKVLTADTYYTLVVMLQCVVPGEQVCCACLI